MNKLARKLIVIEGADGSGKETQLGLLRKRVELSGVPVVVYDFPRYDHFYGQEAGRRQKGDTGPLMAIDPFFMALLYANDRWQVAPEIEDSLNWGYCVLINRYVASNLAHGSAKYTVVNDALDFIRRVERMEYIENRLPQPSLQLFLDVPAPTAKKMALTKGEREYMGGAGIDLAEADMSHQEKAVMMYRWLCANRENFVRLDCSSGESEILPREEINNLVWQQLELRGWV